MLNQSGIPQDDESLTDKNGCDYRRKKNKRTKTQPNLEG
jgi:hypothetical protein